MFKPFPNAGNGALRHIRAQRLAERLNILPRDIATGRPIVDLP